MLAGGSGETPRSARMLTGDRPMGVLNTGSNQLVSALAGVPLHLTAWIDDIGDRTSVDAVKIRRGTVVGTPGCDRAMAVPHMKQPSGLGRRQCRTTAELFG